MGEIDATRHCWSSVRVARANTETMRCAVELGDDSAGWDQRVESRCGAVV